MVKVVMALRGEDHSVVVVPFSLLSGVKTFVKLLLSV